MQHRKLFLAAAGAALAIALTACSGTGAPAGTPAGTASAPQESAVVETQTPAPEAESHTLQATLNSVDTGLDFLVAVDENGNYCRLLPLQSGRRGRRRPGARRQHPDHLYRDAV